MVLVVGDDADGVRIARHAVIRFGKAVELRTVHVGLHTLPSSIETTEISLVAGQRLERGRADGHLVECRPYLRPTESCDGSPHRIRWIRTWRKSCRRNPSGI